MPNNKKTLTSAIVCGIKREMPPVRDAGHHERRRFCETLFAAHRAAHLAGVSPAAVIGCLPYSYNRRLTGVTRQAKAR